METLNLPIYLTLDPDTSDIIEAIGVGKFLKPVKDWNPTNQAAPNELLTMALWRKESTDEYIGLRSFQVSEYQIKEYDRFISTWKGVSKFLSIKEDK